MTNTISLSLANFVGSVVGFLSVCTIRLRSLLLAASLSFESEMYNIFTLTNHCFEFIFLSGNTTSHLNLSGLYSPKLASFLELLPTLRYPAACCGEVHWKK